MQKIPKNNDGESVVIPSSSLEVPVSSELDEDDVLEESTIMNNTNEPQTPPLPPIYSFLKNLHNHQPIRRWQIITTNMSDDHAGNEGDIFFTSVADVDGEVQRLTLTLEGLLLGGRP